MCGICGIIAMSSDRSACSIDAMLRTLVHRGPDLQRTWEDGAAKLGHARLSIIDLTENGSQPMVSPDGRIAMACNGEIYNYRELRKELQALGHVFKGRSDSEVLLHAFWRWDTAVFPRLHGMFAAAFWDREARTLTLVRDRFGIKPLYYSAESSGFLFASEIKALLKVAPQLKRLSHQGLIEYLVFQNPLGENTLYQNILRLLPGCYLQLLDGKLTTTKYWSPLDVAPIADDEETAVHRVRALLEQAVNSHLVSDVPVGLFLSGGVDSSALAMLAGRKLGRRLTAFTVEFDFAQQTEVAGARNIAELAGIQHQSLSVHARDIPGILRNLTEAHDQPFGDAANLPLFLLAEAVKPDVTVVLQGDGGDEVFGGYDRYRNLCTLEHWKRRIGPLLQLLYFSRAYRLLPLRCRRWLEIACCGDLVKSHALLTGHYVDLFPMGMFTKQAQRELRRCDPHLRFRELSAAMPASEDHLQTALLFDTMILLPDKFLEKVDKPTMAHSIEARVPLLDGPLTEYVLGLPSHMKVRSGETKYVFKRALRGLVPDSVLDAPKTGFGVPVLSWLRGPLAENVRDLLGSSAFRYMDLFDRRGTESVVQSGLNGNAEDARITWLLYRLADWIEAYRIAA